MFGLGGYFLSGVPDHVDRWMGKSDIAQYFEGHGEGGKDVINFALVLGQNSQFFTG